MRMNVGYQLDTETIGNITLASGSHYSAHADFFNSWDQPKLQQLVDDCLNGHRNCGHFKGSTPAQR